MSAEAATEFDSKTKELGDKIVGLTLLEAKRVVDYLKEVHGIEPAGGGAMMMAAAPGAAAEAAVEQTESAYGALPSLKRSQAASVTKLAINKPR